VLEDYIRDHSDSWFDWAKTDKLGVKLKSKEDIIIVSGCTLVSSWAAAVSTNHNHNSEAEISLASRAFSNGRASFTWSNIRGPVEYRNSRLDRVCFLGNIYSTCTNFFSFLYGKDPTILDQCVFIKGFRAKRVPFRTFGRLRAAAEPLPDDPDNRRDDEIQVTRVPRVPKVSNLPTVR
jgi:hypothetical protein